MKERPKARKSSSYKVSDKIVYRVIDGEAAVVRPDDGALILLNETGTFILKNSKNTTSTDRLIQKVVKEYDITEAKARKDVEQFLRLLVKEGIIEEIK